MEIGYVTSVTISEFMVWYASGELRLLRRRVVPVKLDPGGFPVTDDLTKRQVTDLLPHVDLEDEHSVLLVTLAAEAWDHSGNDGLSTSLQPLLLEVIYVPASAVLSIHPLTKRGGGILQARLQGLDVRLGAPVFEDATGQLWQDWSRRRAHRGAAALLEITVKEPGFRPSSGFLREADTGLTFLDEQREPPDGASLLVHVLCYSRHDPIPEFDVGFLLDLGVILRDHLPDRPGGEPVVGRLRDLCKAMNKDTRALPDLLALPETHKVLSGKRFEDPGDLDLFAATQFLKWKHRAQGKLGYPLEKLLADVHECSGKVTRLAVEQALWLFGFFLGFDRLAHDLYIRSPKRYRFLSRSVPHEAVVLSEEVQISIPVPEEEVEDVATVGASLVGVQSAAEGDATADGASGPDGAEGSVEETSREPLEGAPDVVSEVSAGTTEESGGVDETAEPASVIAGTDEAGSPEKSSTEQPPSTSAAPEKKTDGGGRKRRSRNKDQKPTTKKRGKKSQDEIQTDLLVQDANSGDVRTKE